jgi:hypothetical protein
MTASRERAIVTLAISVIVAAAAVSSLSLGPAARRMPLVVALPTLGLLLFEWIRARRDPATPSGPRPLEPIIVGWLAVLVTLTVVLGVLAGPPLVLAAFLRLRSRERWRVALGMAAAFAAVVFVVFHLVLDLPSGGIVGGWPR